MADVKRRPAYPKPLRFATAPEEFTFSEFENKYGNEITYIVMVKKGGRIGDLEFHKGQVLTLQSYSRNDRVVARPLDPRYKDDMYGIPTYMSQHFVVVDVLGKELSGRGSLHELLKHHKPPFRVMFPRGEYLKHETKTLNTMFAPQLEILYEFIENHFLANVIVEDKLKDDIIYIPLYDSDVRVSMVTGIIGMEDAVFKRFKEDIDKDCSSFEYDMLYGKINVAIYTQGDSLRRIPITRCTPPKRFSCFALMYDRPRMPLPIEKPTNEKPDTMYCEDYVDMDAGYELLKTNPCADTQFKDELKQVLGDTSGNKELTLSKNIQVPPKVLPKPRPVAEDKKHTVSDRYMNTIPRGHVYPIPKDTPKPSGEVRAVNRTVTSEKPAYKMNQSDIKDLTIDAVCDVLKNLNLEKYVDIFREQMIDGQLLLELDDSILETEFGFRRVESMRLRKFIKEGHVPI